MGVEQLTPNRAMCATTSGARHTLIVCGKAEEFCLIGACADQLLPIKSKQFDRLLADMAERKDQPTLYELEVFIRIISAWVDDQRSLPIHDLAIAEVRRSMLAVDGEPVSLVTVAGRACPIQIAPVER
jgi:hypothetical protein